MSVSETEDYKREIARLKEKYADQIDVFCGIEFDMYSPDDLQDYDYVIGSVHYLLIDGEYVGFDRDADTVASVIDTYFGGDGMKYAKKYYEAVAQLPDYGRTDIVGHFDLITKHAEKRCFFDTESKAYRHAAVEAMETLIARDVRLFEVNTGAIPRGYRTTPYPDLYLLKQLRQLGGEVLISSDCHDNRCLNANFEQAEDLIRAAGFQSVWNLTGRGFAPQAL